MRSRDILHDFIFFVDSWPRVHSTYKTNSALSCSHVFISCRAQPLANDWLFDPPRCPGFHPECRHRRKQRGYRYSKEQYTSITGMRHLELRRCSPYDFSRSEAVAKNQQFGVSLRNHRIFLHTLVCHWRKWIGLMQPAASVEASRLNKHSLRHISARLPEIFLFSERHREGGRWFAYARFHRLILYVSTSGSADRACG